MHGDERHCKTSGSQALVSCHKPVRIHQLYVYILARISLCSREAELLATVTLPAVEDATGLSKWADS
jgi:hypothetical protein